ncbi:MAG: hypothetical protein D6726_11280 [Nitrospirae bacterium]|nr:MAG: hypothetical protein D6726_11280 [Nitrospirota bacterium]
MVRGNICYHCGKELPFWYVEEGDLTISRERIVCPHCGWTLEGAWDSYDDEEEKPDEEEKNA